VWPEVRQVTVYNRRGGGCKFDALWAVRNGPRQSDTQAGDMDFVLNKEAAGLQSQNLDFQTSEAAVTALAIDQKPLSSRTKDIAWRWYKRVRSRLNACLEPAEVLRQSAEVWLSRVEADAEARAGYLEHVLPVLLKHYGEEAPLYRELREELTLATEESGQRGEEGAAALAQKALDALDDLYALFSGFRKSHERSLSGIGSAARAACAYWDARERCSDQRLLPALAELGVDSSAIQPPQSPSA